MQMNKINKFFFFITIKKMSQPKIQKPYDRKIK